MRSLLTIENDSFIKYPSRHSPTSRGNSNEVFGRTRFSDEDYLMKLVAFLRVQRKARGLSSIAIARQSGLSKRLIESFENGHYIPNTRQLKAWTAGLGFKWEDVWSLALLTKLEIKH
jgi:ribosome-binding protein aMBF1 (putative translation factor)